MLALSVVFLRTLLLLLALWMLYRMWSFLSRQSKWIALLVTAGFLSRALAGVILFWVSYLGLPIGSHLQLGDGLWFFALDGKEYMRLANGAASSGPDAIIFIARSVGSFFYVQVLAAFVLLFGGVAATGLLLNLFSYLASCLAIVWWGRETANEKVARLAIGALALSPSGILWALQPLKDTFFLFLIVAFASLAMRWQVTWRSTVEKRALPLILTSILMWIVLFGIAGIRWYFAVVTWVACAIFLLLVVFTAARPVKAFFSAIALTLVLSQAVLIGSGDYLPDMFRRIFSLRAASELRVEVGQKVMTQVEASRDGFDRTGGATLIKPGPASAPSPSPPRPDSTPRVVIARKPSLPTEGAKVAQPPLATPAPGTEPTAAPATSSDELGTVVETAPAPTSTTSDTRLQRMIAGTAAVLLPRAIAQRLGLYETGGGRGFWLFVELDTLVFDLILAVAIFYTVRSIRRSFRSPVFWHVALMTVMVAVPLVYTVSNFGTLFRHRSMIYVGLALIPLALASSTETGRRWKDDIGPEELMRETGP